MPRSVAGTVVIVVALGLVPTLAGCQAVRNLMNDPYLMQPSPGRAVRTIDADLATVGFAALAGLDDQGIAPKDLSLREAGGAAMNGDGFRMPRSNAELAGVLKVLRSHQVGEPGHPSIPFDPALIHYRGTTRDGRPVTLTLILLPQDRPRTSAFAKVGRSEDKAEAEALIDAIASRARSGPAAAPSATP